MVGKSGGERISGVRPVEEYRLGFNPEVLDLPNNVFLFGYWTSEKYFKDIAAVLREELALKEPLSENTKRWKKIIESEKMPVSLHIRRGDYVQKDINRKIYVQLPVSYYHKAVDLIKEYNDISSLFVFSNDIPWCKEQFKFDVPVYYVEGNDDDHGYEDMYLMSLCRHNVAANSTFSWWGAWLNRNKDKMVICPQRYFNSYSRWRDSTDIWPENWIKM